MEEMTTEKEQLVDGGEIVTCPGCDTPYHVNGTGKVQCDACGICITC